jgi:hypothetical protein
MTQFLFDTITERTKNLLGAFLCSKRSMDLEDSLDSMMKNPVTPGDVDLSIQAQATAGLNDEDMFDLSSESDGDDDILDPTAFRKSNLLAAAGMKNMSIKNSSLSLPSPVTEKRLLEQNQKAVDAAVDAARREQDKASSEALQKLRLQEEQGKLAAVAATQSEERKAKEEALAQLQRCTVIILPVF